MEISHIDLKLEKDPVSETLIKDQLWAIKRSVPDHVCQFLIDKAEHCDKKESKWTFKPCNYGGSLNSQLRNSWEINLGDDDIKKMFWQFIKPFVPQKYQGRRLVGPHYKTFYLLRYFPGEKFSSHRDGHTTNSKGEKSFITALLYLNNCKKGGCTQFFEESHLGICFKKRSQWSGIISPTKGTLVLMRHFIMHQALPVEDGVKYALRFNILYEKFGDWYQGPSRPDMKEGEICKYGKSSLEDLVYKFLPIWIDNPVPGRLPKEGEDRCGNCYEIIDLKYDYYVCPGCQSPVVYTQR